MAEQALRQAAEALSICKGSTREGASFFAGRRPQGHLLAALCERGDVGIAPYEMTCRVGPMCPAAKDTFSPAGHAGPALQGARVLGGQSRPPLQTGRRTPRAFVPLRSTAGRRPLRRGLPHPSVGRAKFFAKPETFPGRWVYDIRKAFHPSKKENPL